MKILSTCIASFLLALFSMNAFADKITIKGNAIAIQKEGEVYVLPQDTTLTADEGYYYFTVGDTKRVCYKEVNEAIKLGYEDFSVRFGTDVVKLHCYTYSPDYFIAE